MIQDRDEIAVAFTLAKFARELRSANDDAGFVEAMERTAVATAYYALYHFTLELAVPRGFPYPGANRHKRLWDWLTEIDGGVGRRCAGIYSARLTAHYKLKTKWIIDSEALVNDVVELNRVVSSVIAQSDQGKFDL